MGIVQWLMELIKGGKNENIDKENLDNENLNKNNLVKQNLNYKDNLNKLNLGDKENPNKKNLDDKENFKKQSIDNKNSLNKHSSKDNINKVDYLTMSGNLKWIKCFYARIHHMSYKLNCFIEKSFFIKTTNFLSRPTACSLDICLYWAVKMSIFWLPGQM